MILDSTESFRGLECAHASERAFRGHHVVEKLTCLSQLYDDFVEFSFISLISTLLRPMIDLNTK